MKTILILIMISAAVATNGNGTFSLVEINPEHGNEQNIFSDSSVSVYGAGSVSQITELNGKIYFVAQDAYNNEELWMSDGTQPGTSLVKDINPGGSAQIGNILKVGNKLLFMATDNNIGDYDLFSSDGTSAGTVKVGDINQSWNDALSAQRSAVFGNKILFCTQTDLMSTDGTISGTNSILSIAAYAAPAQGYCELNGNAYFMLTNNLGKPEIWLTDGTAANTLQALDLGLDTFNIVSVEKLFAYNGQIFLVCYTTGMSGLFSFDGNIHGELLPVTMQGNMFYPRSINVFNNELFFVETASNRLCHYGLCYAEPVPVASVANIPVGANNGLSYCGHSVYFIDDNMREIHSVNTDDLTHQVIELTNYRMPYYYNNETGFAVGAGGKIFFAAYDTIYNSQFLMESDGTTPGTHPLMPSGANITHPFNRILGCGFIDVFDFSMWGNKVIIPADFNDAGRELWIYEPDALVNSIQPEQSEIQIGLFPNPASNNLLVHIENTKYCELRILNLSGELMSRQTIREENTRVDVSSLSAGSYCASFVFSDTRKATNKIFVVSK